jgi:phage I-like protein
LQELNRQVEDLTRPISAVVDVMVRERRHYIGNSGTNIPAGKLKWFMGREGLKQVLDVYANKDSDCWILDEHLADEKMKGTFSLREVYAKDTDIMEKLDVLSHTNDVKLKIYPKSGYFIKATATMSKSKATTSTKSKAATSAKSKRSRKR